MVGKLEGRVAIVTGSARGIGRGIAQKLSDEGAKIVVNGTTQDAIDETVEMINGEGGTARGIRADVRHGSEVEAMIESTVAEWGQLDIVVNNAGVNRDAMFEKMTEDQWDEVMDTHLKGAWLMCKYAAPHFRAQSYGRVINVGSEGAMFGNMGMVNYVSAKAGMMGLTMTISRELGRWVRKEGGDMTCNLIMPGFNVTRMTDGVPDELRQNVLDQIVLGRVADSREDVGSVVAFLASPDARYVTGSKIGANGGLHMSLGT
jgi:NAD(P)-dependent dehydrogenase (short-subunit alcohol dehydrogenase family)